MFFKKKKNKIETTDALNIIEPPTIERVERAHDTSLKQDPEMQQMLARMEEIKNDLDSKMKHIHELSGISPKKLNEFLNDPTNFSPSDWEKMIKEKDEFQSKFWGEDARRMKKVTKKAEQKKLSRGRKKRMVASRKKWQKM